MHAKLRSIEKPARIRAKVLCYNAACVLAPGCEHINNLV